MYFNNNTTRCIFSVRRQTLNDWKSTEQDIIRNDLEVTRKLLREVQDHVEKLEAYVLILQDNSDIISEERYKLIEKLILLLSVQCKMDNTKARLEACALEDSTV